MFPLRSEVQEQSFDFWIDGIFWSDTKGIRTLVEIFDKRRILILIASRSGSGDLENKKHRSAVIKLVLDLCQEICPNVVKNEYLISQSLLNSWQAKGAFLQIDDDKLFPIENVAKSLLNGDPYVFSKDGTTDDSEFSIKNLQFEPYCQLSCSTVRELMDDNKANEPVSQHLLHEVQTKVMLDQLKLQSHSSLRRCIDELSIFIGRNLIVSFLIS